MFVYFSIINVTWTSQGVERVMKIEVKIVLLIFVTLVYKMIWIDRNYKISEAGVGKKYGDSLPKGHFDPGAWGHLSQF